MNKRRRILIMKAAVVVANEDVQYLDYEEPQAGPGSAALIFHVSFTMACIFIRSFWDMSSPATWWKSERVLQR